MPRTVTLQDRARSSARRSARPRHSCSRSCWRGVTDRVVVAITFLALLELVKGRELTVEQAEPWGPIMSADPRRGRRAGRRAVR